MSYRYASPTTTVEKPVPVKSTEVKKPLNPGDIRRASGATPKSGAAPKSASSKLVSEDVEKKEAPKSGAHVNVGNVISEGPAKATAFGANPTVVAKDIISTADLATAMAFESTASPHAKTAFSDVMNGRIFVPPPLSAIPADLDSKHTQKGRASVKVGDMKGEEEVSVAAFGKNPRIKAGNIISKKGEATAMSFDSDAPIHAMAAFSSIISGKKRAKTPLPDASTTVSASSTTTMASSSSASSGTPSIPPHP